MISISKKQCSTAIHDQPLGWGVLSRGQMQTLNRLLVNYHHVTPARDIHRKWRAKREKKQKTLLGTLDHKAIHRLEFTIMSGPGHVHCSTKKLKAPNSID